MTIKPEPLKSELFSPYTSAAKISISNISTKGVTRVAGAMHNDLKESTQHIIVTLSQKLSESGITVDKGTDKELKVVVEKVSMPVQALFANACEFDVIIEMGNGKKKRFVTRDVNSQNLFRVCDFAMAKVVAEIYNDKEIRAYIDGNPYLSESYKTKNASASGASAEERLEKLKALLDKGLISQNQFDKKSDEILKEM